MSHQLILEVPEAVYEPLADTARRTGTSLEQLAVEWLAAASVHAAQDPLEGFIGAFRSSVPDWAEQHDEHLGQSLKDELGGTSAGK